MYDKLLVVEVINQILQAISRIEYRFKPVTNPDYFLADEAGLEKLDSICMALIGIGESLKNIDKISEKKLFINYTNIPWKRVMGMRDIISHHYFDIDAETVFDVCNSELNKIRIELEKIKEDLLR
ncbi:DUF86 domain-containing protein [Thiospirochaeta perfilievii]|uniref:DUF86 domain-containing protein n=1 Tax=Thiospirochaeta perfilievii TaxID=252967 RepID=A0A5C1QE26_9SPIO|nr:HepT-like ribonuclease domain-containing protein [Thiospirochaeta perfilievii]QEN05637.1 DUF86 domain-containing protein [Thiospirochaeta perfilievii]